MGTGNLGMGCVRGGAACGGSRPSWTELGYRGLRLWGISLLASVACNPAVTVGGASASPACRPVSTTPSLPAAAGGYVPAPAPRRQPILIDKLGCVACRSSLPDRVGDEVRITCSERHSRRAHRTALWQRCRDGACIDACEVAPATLIYLVDDQNNFCLFRPRMMSAPGRAGGQRLPSLARWLARRPNWRYLV